MFEPENTTNPVVENEVPKKFYQKKWGKILIAVIIVIGLLIGSTMLATSGAVKVSNKFIDAMQASNSSGAYALFSSEAKKSVDSEEFASVVKQVGPILNTKEKITSREISSDTDNGSSAKITYELTGTDNLKYEIVVDLVKENGEWVVLNFDSNESK